MLRLDANKPVHLCDGLTRRDFFQVFLERLRALGASRMAMDGLAAAELSAFDWADDRAAERA